MAMADGPADLAVGGAADVVRQHRDAGRIERMERPAGVVGTDMGGGVEAGKHVAAAEHPGLALRRLDATLQQQPVHRRQRRIAVGGRVVDVGQRRAAVHHVAHRRHGAPRVGEHDGHAGAEQRLQLLAGTGAGRRDRILLNLSTERTMAKTILMVDDSASLRAVVSMALTGAGYEVMEAANGRDALDKLDKLNGKKVHLIISDVNMPVMGGIEFLTKVKQEAAFKFTPVIMLTTEGQDAIKEQGRAAGAKAWVMKPFNPTQMLGAVSKLFLP
jgi:two-component system chemotaxis response regulator CheY